jgi:hypothetical protein
VARYSRDQELTFDPRRTPLVTSGVDARWQTGPGSYLEGSVLTDFAEVNIDEVNIAGDRFPIFFPEQRPFFINGLSIVNFGRQGVAQLFNSRTVGLRNGRTVPILAAAKAYGQADGLSYGVLDVQTLGTEANPNRNIPETQPEHFAIGRVRYSPNQRSWLGAMALARHTFDREDADHLSLGVDGELRSQDGNFNWYSFGAFTRTEPTFIERRAAEADLETEEGASLATTLSYRNLGTYSELTWTWSDETFDPELGFYERTGVSKQTGLVQWTPRPAAGTIRQITVGPTWETTSNAEHTELLKRSLGAEAIVDFDNTAQFTYRYADELDVVDAPFSLFGYEIPEGRYQGPFHRIALRSPMRQWARGQFVYRHQRIFGGYRHTLIETLTLRPSAHFSFDGTYTYLLGRFAEGEEYAVSFANTSLEIAIHKNLVFDVLGRLNLTPNRERIGFQTRLQYRYRPGSDIFIVGRGDQPVRRDASNTEPSRYEVLLKFTHYFRQSWDR